MKQIKKINEELQKFVLDEISDELVDRLGRYRYIDKQVKRDVYGGDSEPAKAAEKKIS